MSLRLLTASKGQDGERHGDGAAAGGTRRWASGRVKDTTKQPSSFISRTFDAYCRGGFVILRSVVTRSNEAHKITTVQEGDLSAPRVDNERRCTGCAEQGHVSARVPRHPSLNLTSWALFRAGTLGVLPIHSFISKHCWYVI